MVLERKLVLDDNDIYCPVRATLALRPNGSGAAPLALDGDALTLTGLKLDGRALLPGQFVAAADRHRGYLGVR